MLAFAGRSPVFWTEEGHRSEDLGLGRYRHECGKKPHRNNRVRCCFAAVCAESALSETDPLSIANNTTFAFTGT